ncbi:hypothetical protein L208DRAFT_1025007, partial [Tricholoma matsutake]
KLEFLIKWKNYRNKNNSWEPKENCKRVHNVIAQFFKCNPNAPRCIARMDHTQFNEVLHLLP